MNRLSVKPELLRWARARSGRTTESLMKHFPRLGLWEQGKEGPTLKQMEAFAKATRTPIGFFFLPEPPVETIPIPDYRAVDNERLGRPSPDLLDTLYICQQRQEWYRDFARSIGEPPLKCAGAALPGDEITGTAAKMRAALGFDIGARQGMKTWEEALRHFIAQADNFGVLVMVSGVVGSNNHRKLDPREFRGFALADDLAPLVFINGADTKAGQMFTLAHELAHVWAGKTALSDATPASIHSRQVESWCGQVAAELLVPLDIFREEYHKDADVFAEANRLARVFKVSALVVLRRMHDAGGLSREQFWNAYGAELRRLREIIRKGGGDTRRPHTSLGYRIPEQAHAAA
jgi:Zn-dependent peptidase ImmA (M78 family)